VLNDYLWLLMLNEHFIDYQACVRDQVQQQLQYVALSSEPVQSEPVQSEPVQSEPVQSEPLPSSPAAAAR
jgi:hypothetical protein